MNQAPWIDWHDPQETGVPGATDEHGQQYCEGGNTEITEARKIAGRAGKVSGKMFA